MMRKVKFVEFDVVGQTPDGKRKITTMPINPLQVCMIVPITIPGMLSGPDGAPMGKAAAGLDFGTQVVAIDCEVTRARILLEDAINGEETKDVNIS